MTKCTLYKASRELRLFKHLGAIVLLLLSTVSAGANSNVSLANDTLRVRVYSQGIVVNELTVDSITFALSDEDIPDQPDPVDEKHHSFAACTEEDSLGIYYDAYYMDGKPYEFPKVVGDEESRYNYRDAVASNGKFYLLLAKQEKDPDAYRDWHIKETYALFCDGEMICHRQVEGYYTFVDGLVVDGDDVYVWGRKLKTRNLDGFDDTDFCMYYYKNDEAQVVDQSGYPQFFDVENSDVWYCRSTDVSTSYHSQSSWYRNFSYIWEIWHNGVKQSSPTPTDATYLRYISDMKVHDGEAYIVGYQCDATKMTVENGNDDDALTGTSKSFSVYDDGNDESSACGIAFDADGNRWEVLEKLSVLNSEKYIYQSHLEVFKNGTLAYSIYSPDYNANPDTDETFRTGSYNWLANMYPTITVCGNDVYVYGWEEIWNEATQSKETRSAVWKDGKYAWTHDCGKYERINKYVVINNE